MRKRKLTLIVFAVFITSTSRVAHSQTKCEPQQRKELVVTVVDPNSAIIDSLERGHFSLKVGNEKATIVDVEFHMNDQPLDIVLMIDASVSQEKVLPLAQTGAKTFITDISRFGRNRVAVVSFSNRLNNNPVLTSDFDAAKLGIDEIKIDVPPGYVGGGVVLGTRPPKKPDVGGSTSLWDIVRSTAQTLFGAGTERRRRAMLLFTDGNDTSSSSSNLKKVIEDVNKYNMAVFSIGLPDSLSNSVNKGDLKKLSENSGGIARFPKDTELETAIDAITHQLYAHYVISYCGNVNSGDKLRVEINHPNYQEVKPVLAYKRF